MKKLLISLIIILSIGNANAARPNPYYHAYHNGYDNGYNIGYNNGKRDAKHNAEKVIAATALISFGAIILYNVITNSNVKSRDLSHYSYRF